MNENDTMILITGLESGTVQNIQSRLKRSGIPSVHISSGNKIPYPVGIRVRRKDLKRATQILGAFGLKPYVYSDSDRKRDKRHVVVIFTLGGIALIFLLLVILGVVG